MILVTIVIRNWDVSPEKKVFKIRETDFRQYLGFYKTLL